MSQGQGPARVRVTAPRTRAVVARSRFSVSRELAEQSELGEMFVRSLMRSQLRLALVVAGGFALILLGVPALMLLFPSINNMTVFTVPLPWVLLGAAIYPVIIICAALYNRAAARNEHRFRQLVDDGRSPRPVWTADPE
ncbi:hypothetical protein [Crystallibacter crystallopoietes]|nr:hypothetical protein [Arthrobacter crystallopoietes]